MNLTWNKALIAAVLAGAAGAIAFAIPVVDDGLVASEVLGIVLAFLTGAGVTGGATYAIPNKGATFDRGADLSGPTTWNPPSHSTATVHAERAGDVRRITVQRDEDEEPWL